MSIECSECEMDLRGGHDPSCKYHPDNRKKELPWKFYEPDAGETAEDARNIQDEWISGYPDHDWSTATDLAQHIYDDAGGDLSDPDSWPIEIRIIGDGRESRWSVEMEYSPDFSATEIKQ